MNNDTKFGNKENISHIIEKSKKDNNSISNYTKKDKDFLENKASIDYNETKIEILNNTISNISNIDRKKITKENISYVEYNSSNITFQNFTDGIDKIKNNSSEFYNETINKEKIEKNDTKENYTTIEKENETLINGSSVENNTNEVGKYNEDKNNTGKNVTEKDKKI